MRKIYVLLLLPLFAMLLTSAAYAQTITINSLTPAGPYCSAETATLNFSTSAAFAAAQNFDVEISDALGTFPALPQVVGTLNSVGGTNLNITVTMPTVALPGVGYLLRIVAAPSATVSTNTTAAFTINPAVSLPVFSAGPAATICQGSVPITYGATAVNATGIVYSLSPAAAGVINSSTGEVTYDPLYTGAATITATAAGCSLPITSNFVVTVTPTVGTPVFNAGPLNTICQASPNITYTATASNTTGITYSISPAGAGTINSSTGEVTYNAGFTGAATITASAAGCGGPKTANFAVNVTGTVTAPVFAAGPMNTICQASPNITYTATASNTTGITYSISPAGAGTINATTGEVTYNAGFSGAATITASAAGCGGPLTTNFNVTVTPTVGTPVFAVGPLATICQASPNVIYGATATNNTGITYSVSPAGAGTINSATGEVTYNAGFSGAVTITASAAGCNGPKTANFNVTVTPSVTTPVFSAGPLTTICQASPNITYTATASNTTGITYSISPAGAGTINSGTGLVTYNAGFSGAVTITASAAGCNGPKTANFNLTVTPTVGTPVFTAGPTPSRCQSVATITYGATATNTSGAITYSLDAASLTAGNSINTATGAVNYLAGYSGTSTITASAPGCNGPKTATVVVATVGIPVFALGANSSRCPGFANITYTATATNNTGLVYSFTGTGGSITNTTTGQIIYDPAVNSNVTITATASGCASPLSSVHTVMIRPNVGAPVFNLPALTPCQNSMVTYTANATDADSVRYSITTNPANGATINATTGAAVFNPSFVGTATVTAKSYGCGPIQSTPINVVIQPVVTQPQFASGPLGTICQAVNPTTVTYTATASNASSLTYSLSPGAAATLFNTNTGQLTYSSSFTGTAVITATATGCNGNSTNTFSVNVTPTVSSPIFTPGNPVARKQAASTVVYGATAANSTSITYSLDAASLLAGNAINSSTGAVTYSSTFSGNSTVTATAAGCNASPTATFNVTTVRTPVFALGASSSRCQNKTNVTYTATSNAGAVTYYLTTSPAAPATTINATTGVVSYDSSFFGTATISAVSTFGAVVTDTARHTVTVNVAPRVTAPTPLSKVICSGDNTSIPLVATTGAGSSFAWTLLGGLGLSGQSVGSTSAINQALTNTSSANPDSIYYVVTVTSPAACPSIIPDSIKVRVNPKPVLTAIAPTTICSEASVNISLGASAPSTFTWTVSAPSKITNAAPGSGNLISQTLNNTDVTLPPGVPSSGTATYSITPTSLAGCMGNVATALVTVNPLPVVVFTTGTSKTICSGQPTSIPLSANIASSFTFTQTTITSLALVTGQSNGSGATINQTLINNSNSVADSIAYSVVPVTTSGAPTCTGKASTVVVRVNPKPAITSTITDSVCSGATTTTPLTATIPSTFTWTLGINTGSITGQQANATGTAATQINQQLGNPSFTTAGFVEYIVTPTSASFPNCTGASKTVTVKVNPSPKLTSDTARSICSNSTLSYQPTSSVTAGTSVFTYDRTSNIPTIANQFQKTTTNILDSLSSNYILSPAVVDYNFTLTSAAGCSLANQHLRVTVNPTPDTPGISIFPRTRLCSGAIAMNFGTSRVPDGREFFRWSTANAGTPFQRADSAFSQNALIGFPNAGTATVTIEAISRGFGCIGKKTNKQMNVASASGAQNINVVLFASNLVAQVTGAKAYQWGFDRKSDLDSTLIPGETTQSYDTRRGFDKDANAYWVMVTFPDDCVQKAYYNSAVLGVETPAQEAVEMKAYPNPVQDVLTLEIMQANTKDLVYEVYDLAGRRLAQVLSNAAKTRIPLGAYAPGYYTVICSQAGVRVAASRFIKN